MSTSAHRPAARHPAARIFSARRSRARLSGRRLSGARLPAALAGLALTLAACTSSLDDGVPTPVPEPTTVRDSPPVTPAPESAAPTTAAATTEPTEVETTPAAPVQAPQAPDLRDASGSPIPYTADLESSGATVLELTTEWTYEGEPLIDGHLGADGTLTGVWFGTTGWGVAAATPDGEETTTGDSSPGLTAVGNGAAILMPSLVGEHGQAWAEYVVPGEDPVALSRTSSTGGDWHPTRAAISGNGSLWLEGMEGTTPSVASVEPGGDPQVRMEPAWLLGPTERGVLATVDAGIDPRATVGEVALHEVTASGQPALILTATSGPQAPRLRPVAGTASGDVVVLALEAGEGQPHRVLVVTGEEAIAVLATGTPTSPTIDGEWVGWGERVSSMGEATRQYLLDTASGELYFVGVSAISHGFPSLASGQVAWADSDGAIHVSPRP